MGGFRTFVIREQMFSPKQRQQLQQGALKLAISIQVTDTPAEKRVVNHRLKAN